MEKRKIGKTSAEKMKKAVELVLQGEYSIRQAAIFHNIPFQTLQRYVNKQHKNPDDQKNFAPRYDVNKIFTSEQETTLEEYLKNCNETTNALTTKQIRKVAYEIAVVNRLKIPKSWETNQQAGRKWMVQFLKRHPDLSAKIPKTCTGLENVEVSLTELC